MEDWSAVYGVGFGVLSCVAGAAIWVTRVDARISMLEDQLTRIEHILEDVTVITVRENDHG